MDINNLTRMVKSVVPEGTTPQSLARDILKQVNKRTSDVQMREDLISEAVMALHKCRGAWDPEKGGSFRTFAWSRIRSAVGAYHRDNCRTLNVFSGREGREAYSNSELRHSAHLPTASLHKVIPGTDGLRLEDTIEADTGDDLNMARGMLHEWAASQDERTRQILGAISEGYNMREIGDQLGISRERVRQLVTKIKTRAQTELAA